MAGSKVLELWRGRSRVPMVSSLRPEGYFGLWRQERVRLTGLASGGGGGGLLLLVSLLPAHGHLPTGVGPNVTATQRNASAEKSIPNLTIHTISYSFFLLIMHLIFFL
jgi:hypothetical protein